jgi:hypothetical protein
MTIKLRKLTILLIVFAVLPLASCTGQGTLDTIKYKNHVLEQRKIKDLFFKKSPESPLLEEQQWKFSQLTYFPVNTDFRIQARLTPIAVQAAVPIKTSTGHESMYVPRLFLEFDLEGEKRHLTAYQSTDQVRVESTSFFVPFTDLTSGKDTYGAGRYLEFDYTGSGLALLDFNYAYNPYCAYNYNYSCPIPPSDNNLTLAVTAGEMAFK